MAGSTVQISVGQFGPKATVEAYFDNVQLAASTSTPTPVPQNSPTTTNTPTVTDTPTETPTLSGTTTPTVSPTVPPVGQLTQAKYSYDGDGNMVKSDVTSQLNGVASETITYYAAGYYNEQVTGDVTKTQKFYSYGSETVAMRTIQGPSGNTLNWIMTDNLNSTTVTANADGTFNSELRYSAFGEIRYSSGVTPTDYQYTGQLADSYIKLSWFNSRWYDNQTAHFVQPDSIIPGLSNSNVPTSGYAWDHYAYVGFSPITRNDPTGHCYSTVNGQLTQECANRWDAYTSMIQQSYISDYGISVGGGSLAQRGAIALAITQMGFDYEPYLPGKSSAQAFKAVYHKATITFSGQGNGCDASGVNSIVCGTSTDSVPQLYAHEFGHKLESVITMNHSDKVGPYADLSVVDVRDNYNNVVFQATSADHYTRTILGYRSDAPPYMYHGKRYWLDWDSNNNYAALHEDFADMFMNWTYNSFDYSNGANGAGTARYDWMSAHMAEWIALAVK
jgi:RHS repeat-associated protein